MGHVVADPQIAGGWRDAAGTGTDPLFEKVFPMDVRPQAHDIIRTWLFSTVVRSHFEHGTVPWTGAAISGWILDPDRKKMAKSRATSSLPRTSSRSTARMPSATGPRAVASAPTPPTTPGRSRSGRRLAIKVLNASKFALSFGDVEGDAAAHVTQPLDLALLAGLRDVVARATAGFEAWDFTRALEVTEQWFWAFCDDYLELVKDRAYGAQGDAAAASARATLRISLDVVLRLLAPILPYVTEEVWSWTHDGSVHRAAWPTVDEVPFGGDAHALAAVGAALAVIRKAKSEAKVGMRAEVPSMTLVGPDAALAHVRSAEADLRAAGRLTGSLDYAEGDEVGARDIELVAVAKPSA